MKGIRKLAITMILFISLFFSQIIVFAADSGFTRNYGLDSYVQNQIRGGGMEDNSLSSNDCAEFNVSKEDDRKDTITDNSGNNNGVGELELEEEIEEELEDDILLLDAAQTTASSDIDTVITVAGANGPETVNIATHYTTWGIVDTDYITGFFSQSQRSSEGNTLWVTSFKDNPIPKGRTCLPKTSEINWQAGDNVISTYTQQVKFSIHITEIPDYAFDAYNSGSGGYFGVATNIKYNLIIPDSVTSIGKYAFAYCGFRGDLIIPDSVTSIGDHAFTGLGSSTLGPQSIVNNLKLSDNLSSIGEGAFSSSCFKGELKIPDSVITIEDYAFYACCNFTGDLIIPESVTSIGDHAFSECAGFTKLNLGDNLETIGDHAFSRCLGFTGDLIIPNSVTSIGDHAFSVGIGSGQMFDGDLYLGTSNNGEIINCAASAFYKNGFTRVYINTLKDIPDNMFRRNYNYSSHGTFDVFFGDEVRTIGDYAFYQCYPSSYYDINDPSWDKTGTPPLKYKGFMGDLVIPNSVTSIGDYAFYGCYGIDSLDLGNVQTIGNYAFSNCYTFENLGSQTTYTGLSGDLIIPNTVTSIGNNAFSSNYALTGDYVIGTSNDGEIEYYGLNVTTGVHFEGDLYINTLKDIPANAFVAYYNSNTPSYSYNCFKNLYLGDEIRTIGNRAFEKHDFQNEVLVIPDSVTSIGDYAFQRNTYLYNQRNPILGGTNTDTFTYETFKERYVDTPGKTLRIGNGVQTIGKYAFEKNDIYSEIEFGDNITSIGDYAFQFCYGISEINFPNCLETIGNGAFQYCINLRSLHMPDNIKTLSQSVFSGCINLKSVELNHVEKLGNQAFFGCYSLKDIDLGDSIKKIEATAFGLCPLIEEVHIPHTIENLGTSPVFNYCLGIKRIIIDDLDNFENFNGSITFYQSTPNCTEIILPDKLSVYDYADVGYSVFNSAFQVFNSAEYSFSHGVYLVTSQAADAFTILSHETQAAIQTTIDAANEARIYGQETEVTASTAVMNDIEYSIRPDDPYYITYDHNGDSNDTKNVWYTMLRVPVVVNLHYKNGGTDNIISFKEFDTEYWKQNGYKADRNGLTGDQIDFIEKYNWGYMDGDGTWNIFDLNQDVSQISREEDTDLNKGMVLNLYRESFQVTFVTDPEATQIDPQFVETGELADRPEDPLKDGFAFVGWYTESDYQNKFDFDNTLITKPTTLYAKFGIAYKITYDLQGGKEPDPANPPIYAEESETITLRQPTKAGYTFTGWSGTALTGDDNLEVIIPTGSTGDREYTANWKANPVVKNKSGDKKDTPSGGGGSSDSSDVIDVNVTNTINIQDAKLPQTGQNWLFVLILAVISGSLIMVGVLPVFKKNRTGFPVIPGCVITGFLVLIVMVALVFTNFKENIDAENASGSIMTALHDVINEAPDDELDDIDVTVIPDIITVDNVAYLGFLALPSLGIELPVSDEWSYPLLKQSPCRYYGTVYTRDMVVCAHNYQSHFGGLNKLNIGDVVTFTDANGHIFDYTVSDIDTLDAYAVEEMTNGEHDLTLFTCTTGGQSRVTVRCDLVSDYL